MFKFIVGFKASESATKEDIEIIAGSVNVDKHNNLVFSTGDSRLKGRISHIIPAKKWLYVKETKE